MNTLSEQFRFREDQYMFTAGFPSRKFTQRTAEALVHSAQALLVSPIVTHPFKSSSPRLAVGDYNVDGQFHQNNAPVAEIAMFFFSYLQHFTSAMYTPYWGSIITDPLRMWEYLRYKLTKMQFYISGFS